MERGKFMQELDFSHEGDAEGYNACLAEFDRLKAAIKELEEQAGIRQSQFERMSKCVDRAIEQRDEAQAEFDRLKLKVASLAADLWDAQAALDEEQNWLGTISEPMNKWRQGATDIADAIELTNQAIASYLNSQKPSEKSIPRTTQGWKDRIWPEKPSEKPKGHFCEDGIWEYIPKSECQRCNPKCEHKKQKGEV